MLFFNRNILSKFFYSTIGSEILCLDRNISNRFTFIMLVNKPIGQTELARRQKRDVKILLNEIFGHDFEAFYKFVSTA